MLPTAPPPRLHTSADPFLIGVRHHSPALAAAIPALLEALQPERVLVELPEDFAPWIAWLAHPDARAPLALAASREGEPGAFYPFADFSPELAAIRWCVARAVPVEPFDQPLRAIAGDTPVPTHPSTPVIDALLAQTGAPDTFALWDRLVEAPALSAPPEAVRRAALMYGWAVRVSTEAASARDLAREAHMRARIAASPVRTAVVLGAFHAAALLPPEDDPLPRIPAWPVTTGPAPVTSLLPYRFDLFDARSGYPAGVLDPAWHQRVYESLRDGGALEPVVATALVAICRDLRERRHTAGSPDAQEAYRMAWQLAHLRGLAGPGRRELLEGIDAALGHGERLGRGRVIAKALERVLIGTQRGQLAPGTPRSGLLPHVESLLTALRLPGPEVTEASQLRLDPLRSDLDRRRHVTLQRMEALTVPYARLSDTGDTDERITHAWRVRWEPATEAGLALAGLFGPTLEIAVEGLLRRDQPAETTDEGVSPAAWLAWVTQVAECGLPALVATALAEGTGELVLRARLPDLVAAVHLVERIDRGLVPGLLPTASAPGAPGALAAWSPEPAAIALLRDELYAAGVRALDGLSGSVDPSDAQALGELVRLARDEDRGMDARLGRAVDALVGAGAPRIAGAAGVARVRLARGTASALGADLGARIEAADAPDSRDALAERLGGAVEAAGTLLESSPGLLDGIARPIEELPDADWLPRLPALRQAFESLTRAARERLLTTILVRLGDDSAAGVVLDVASLLLATTLDIAGRAAVEAEGLWPEPLAIPLDAHGADTLPEGPPRPTHPAAGARNIGPLQRWRLVLGLEDSGEGVGAPYASALEELYGRGQGEGSRDELAPSRGRGSRWPTTREWADEIGALFGGHVREEVLGRAAAHGDGDALLLLDPETVTPSIALLEAALSLKGGLAEAQLATLRRLCQRVTDSLRDALAVRVRPALTGLSSPRPTRRGDRLHLRRTVLANLRTARPTDTGWSLVPERLWFRSRARRQMDWHIALVVDTSGSMEASVIHAAMMAAILAALPAVSVSFYAFADEVLELTDRVDDPLGLLLEVKVGGGTRIHRALRYARDRVRVPQRTLCVLVTDFEEGGSVGALLAEVRALAEAGVTLLGLAALDEAARPRYSTEIAARVVEAGMPVAALTPLELARWVAERIRG